ncbi:hypothetical protein [Azotobacter chroococcum]|uniref:hypothetical protein n=1 Tax=Azotobacter chroococcum TaxID=353 RepID=UPI0011866375|nr:hypothetical protein [Azotobacter chroococcum]
MGTIFETGEDEIIDVNDVTIDESEGLQTSGVATATEDNNDDDILLSSIATLLGTLDTLGAPAGEAIEAAQNRVLTFGGRCGPEPQAHPEEWRHRGYRGAERLEHDRRRRPHHPGPDQRHHHFRLC